MKIKEMYQYFWYKIYKCMECQELWPNLRTGLFIGGHQMIFLASILMYYSVFIERVTLPNNIYLWIGGIVIVLWLIEYYYIDRNNQWEEIIKKFDQWPKKKNFRGTLIVWGIVFLIDAVAIYGFYMMSQVDWNIAP